MNNTGTVGAAKTGFGLSGAGGTGTAVAGITALGLTETVAGTGTLVLDEVFGRAFVSSGSSGGGAGSRRAITVEFEFVAAFIAAVESESPTLAFVSIESSATSACAGLCRMLLAPRELFPNSRWAWFKPVMKLGSNHNRPTQATMIAATAMVGPTTFDQGFGRRYSGISCEEAGRAI